MIDQVRPFNGFDYVYNELPTIDVNPGRVGVTWCNLLTGEVFVCTDASGGLNVWIGQMGHTISYYSLPRPEILTSFDSPSTSPRGLTFDGTNLISCDYTADKIYVHKRADEIGL